jgi:hypothetical protein
MLSLHSHTHADMLGRAYIPAQQRQPAFLARSLPAPPNLLGGERKDERKESQKAFQLPPCHGQVHVARPVHARPILMKISS